MAEKQTDVARREERGLSRREAFPSFADPYRMLDRFADEMDRVFEDFGLGRSWLGPRMAEWSRPRLRRTEGWLPSIEMLQRNNQLVIRADLPGLTKDDVRVDVTEEAVTIQGERRREHEEEKGGVYRSECSYGSFARVIPLPQGAMTDQAKASFKDGVLEIAMPAPPESVTRGRKLDITEAASTSPKK
jgi:HSP20 family protein